MADILPSTFCVGRVVLGHTQKGSLGESSSGGNTVETGSGHFGAVKNMRCDICMLRMTEVPVAVIGFHGMGRKECKEAVVSAAAVHLVLCAPNTGIWMN